MANNIKFEVKNPEAEVSLGGKIKVELSGLQQELINKKNELLAKKTNDEAAKFLEGLPILSDDTKKLIVLGDKFIQFEPSDPNKYQEALNEFKASIDTANAEIAKKEFIQKLEGEVAVQPTTEEIKTMEKDLAIQPTKEETIELKKEVVDRTFLNAPLKEQLERNTVFQNFLLGRNDFERSLKEYNDSQVDAFKTMLLSAMQWARDKYALVNGKQGEVKFTLNEWYTLQFVDAHKDQLKGKIKDKTRDDLLAKYRAGLKPDGTPKNLQGYENPNNSINPASVEQKPTDWKEEEKKDIVEANEKENTEKIVDKPASDLTDSEIQKLSPADRNKKIEEATMEIYGNAFNNAGKWLVLRKEGGQNILTLSAVQYRNFEALGRLGYINDRVASTQERPTKTSGIDRKIMKLRSIEQKAIESRDYKKSKKLSAEILDLTKQQADDAAETNYYMQKSANYESYRAKNAGDAAAASAIWEMIQLEWYTGITYLVKPAAPVFMNICRNVCARQPNVWWLVDLGNNVQAVIECPELTKKYNNQVNDYTNYTNPDSYEQCTDGGKKNVLQQFFEDHTKMSPEQARKNAALLTAWGIGVGLFFLGKWLFTGKWPDGKEAKAWWFFWRAWILLGGAIGLNMLSEWFTGNKAMDIIKWLRYGDVKFSELLSGKVGKEDWLGSRYDIANNVLQGIPMGALSNIVTEGPNWAANINLSLLENSINQRLASPQLIQSEKDRLSIQLQAVQALKNEPNGEQEFQKILTEMWITYAYITDPLNAKNTVAKISNSFSKHTLELQEYLTKNSLEFAVPKDDPEILLFYKTGKPTPEQLGAKWKFTLKKVEEQINDNVEIRDEALKQIDSKQGKILQDALNKVHGTIQFKNMNDRPRFEYKNNILYLRSYGLDTPIYEKDGNYFLWKMDIAFPSPEKAIKTASLINFLILTNNGAWNVDAPFTVTGSSLKVGDKDLTWWNWLDKTGLALWAKQYFGNTEAVDGDDRKAFPWRESSLENIGWNALGSVAGVEKLKNYLNGMRNAKWSIWNKNAWWITTTNEIIDNTTSVVSTPPKGSSDGNKPDDAKDSKDADKNKWATDGGKENSENTRKNMKERTKEKWDGFSEAVKTTTTALWTFFTGVFNWEVFRKPDSAQVAAFRKETEYYKQQLADFEKMNKFSHISFVDVKKIEELRLNIQENGEKIKEIEELADEKIDSVLVAAQRIPQKQKIELTFSKKRLNFTKKFENRWDRASFELDQSGRVFLRSVWSKTEIKFEKGNYYLVWMNVAFTSSDHIVRIANITNYIKTNFHNRSSANEVEKNWAWKEDGWDLQFSDATFWEWFWKWNILGVDKQVIDGDDYINSTLKEIWWEAFQSQVWEYALYLNKIKDVDGNSYWAKKEQTPEETEKLVKLRDRVIALIKGWVLQPLYRLGIEYPGSYKGPLDTLTPGKKMPAKVEISGWLVTYKSHNQKSINIVENDDNTYKVGYQNEKSESGTLENNFLNVNFPTLEEALRVANLINFYRQSYAWYGNWKKPFNESAGDLEFSDGAWDSRALNVKKLNGVLDTLINRGRMVVFKDWLNTMWIWKKNDLSKSS